MDGENNGSKPYFLMGWFGGVKKPIFGLTPINWTRTWIYSPSLWWHQQGADGWRRGPIAGQTALITPEGCLVKGRRKRGGGPCEYVQRTPSKTTQVQEIEKNICILYTYLYIYYTINPEQELDDVGRTSFSLGGAMFNCRWKTWIHPLAN